MTDDTHTVTASRLTLATAADLLREYETELESAGADGPYTHELRETIERLDSALGNETSNSDSSGTDT